MITFLFGVILAVLAASILIVFVRLMWGPILKYGLLLCVAFLLWLGWQIHIASTVPGQGWW